MKNSVLLLGLMLLVACDSVEVTPVDIAGQPIIGHWYFSESVEENGMHFYQRLYLHVREDGFVLYANVLCKQSLSSGVRSESRLILDYLPVKQINVKKLVLQKYPLTPKFEILLGQWPDQGSGVFEVDNMPLRPIAAAEKPDVHSWECQ